jgi:hypothetical protein
MPPSGLRVGVNPDSRLHIGWQWIEMAAFSSRFLMMNIRSAHCSRYIFGRRVLIGLSYAETREFESLDAEPPIDRQGQLLHWEIEEKSFPPNQARWLELYNKHRAACARVNKTDATSQ